MNNNDKNWWKLNTLSRNCDPSIMFGITDRSNEPDYLYAGRSPRKGSTVIWAPKHNARISIGSYVEAVRNNDTEALVKLQEIGVPININFGYGPNDDMSSTYTVVKKPRAKKSPSVKVMRAEYAAEYEDGVKFKPGEIVKILFRKKFVRDNAGAKKFKNVYERPTEDEIKEFLESEKKSI